jgi:glycyl-tRNA synthetase beta chain
LLPEIESKDLLVALEQARNDIQRHLEAEEFVQAMATMAGLRAPVDAFFEKVRVNDEDRAKREQKLRLLSRLRGTLHQVADFSKIEG